MFVDWHALLQPQGNKQFTNFYFVKLYNWLVTGENERSLNWYEQKCCLVTWVFHQGHIESVFNCMSQELGRGKTHIKRRRNSGEGTGNLHSFFPTQLCVSLCAHCCCSSSRCWLSVEKWLSERDTTMTAVILINAVLWLERFWKCLAQKLGMSGTYLCLTDWQTMCSQA